MRAVILAGGRGTRLMEETVTRPKPMVEIGGMPILWHIMKLYSTSGITDFVVCTGYKGAMIREFFANYHVYVSDVTFHLGNNRATIHEHRSEDWNVTVVDTGEDTMTGGRLKRVATYIGDETFCMTYGDGVADVDIEASIAFHRAHGRQATITAVRPPGRYGALKMRGELVEHFQEKPEGENAWINGGFFVLEPSVLDLVHGDDTVWESGPLPILAGRGQLAAYRHHGFWQPMDTLREKHHLEALWASGKAPWKRW
jgi:glucose-1-phosphate cytidylyltransferase